ncbi:hypothetical protein CHZ71_003399 [Escherichia coli]|nr:hypothetical protein [Escherichia coli]EHI0300816.1 hypothetical protein [Escherichia coli]
MEKTPKELREHLHLSPEYPETNHELVDSKQYELKGEEVGDMLGIVSDWIEIDTSQLITSLSQLK